MVGGRGIRRAHWPLLACWIECMGFGRLSQPIYLQEAIRRKLSQIVDFGYARISLIIPLPTGGVRFPLPLSSMEKVAFRAG
jgi:hypothetical protein